MPARLLSARMSRELPGTSVVIIIVGGSVRLQKYEEMKAELIRIERMMLRAFGFIVHVEHPHKLVLNHLHLMLLDSGDEQHPHPLMQEAWNLTNDRCCSCIRCCCPHVV